jgi:hypothetical protein
MKGFVISIDVQAARDCPLIVRDGASRVETMQAYQTKRVSFELFLN